MHRIIIISILFFTLSQSHMALAQDEKLSLGLELNPILNLYDVQSSMPSIGQMDNTNPNVSLGLTFYYTLGEKSKIDFHMRYSKHRQVTTQTDFFGYLDDASFTRGTQEIGNVALGIDWNQKILNTIYCTFGGSINVFKTILIGRGYHTKWTPDLSSNLESIYYTTTPATFSPTYHLLSLSAGIYKEVNIGRKNKQMLIGLRFKYPMSQMPVYSTRLELETTDQGSLAYDVNYNYTAYQIDLLLSYKIFRKME